MTAVETVRSGGQRWKPEDGPVTIRTASGAVYLVDGRRRISGGTLSVRDAVVCGAVDHPDGPIRVPEIVVGLRMEIVTSAGPVYSSIVTEIVPTAAEAARAAGDERSGPWPRTA
ncbi:MAG: hypothetical protein HY359_00050 [Candidatus Rokubacteria bacterium]|nr:hypothetical protein [Candidatus Rokubacteria bacterium]